MRKQKGFSLIELLIVVAIILIIAAIAIPNLLRARIAANESSAAASIRTISTAEVTYQSAYPATGYAAALGNLGGAIPCTPAVATACLIDNFLASNGGGKGKSGYNFTAIQGPTTQQYAAGALPISASTGVKSYCSIEDGVVRFDPAGAAGATYAGCSGLTALNN